MCRTFEIACSHGWIPQPRLKAGWVTGFSVSKLSKLTGR